MRIQRKQNNLSWIIIFNAIHCICSEWFPVAHSYENFSCEVFIKLCFKQFGLFYGRIKNRRFTADFLILFLNFGSTFRRYKLCKLFPKQKAERKVNYIGVIKKIV